MNMKIPVLCIVLSFGLGTGLAAAAGKEGSFPGIEALMTPAEYQAAGLEQLTPQQREALDQWLIRYTAEDAPVLMRSDEQVKQAAQEQEIVATIVSPFSGWSGNTIFTLDNGQVWQQRRQSRYAYTGGASAPEVRITRNFMGFYSMELLETGTKVLVKRLE
jgi:hypothetical protein